jgi:hypothetical protein
MNNFPSCFRRRPALHQMVQGEGVVNPRIVDHHWRCSLASRLRGSTTAWRKSRALGIGAFSLCPQGRVSCRSAETRVIRTKQRVDV